MDVYDPISFAVLDTSTAKNELQLILPNLSPLGRIESVEVSVAFIGNAANTRNLRFDGYKPTVGPGGGAAITTVATAGAPTIVTGTWPAAYWTQDWDFGGSTQPYDLRVDFAPGAAGTQKASIIWAMLCWISGW